MVKASNTAVANYAPTSLFYTQTNAVYRFYTYQLVIDDAPAIVDGQYWPLQNLTSTNLSMGSSCEVPFLAKKRSQNLSNFQFGCAPARFCSDWCEYLNLYVISNLLDLGMKKSHLHSTSFTYLSSFLISSTLHLLHAIGPILLLHAARRRWPPTYTSLPRAPHPLRDGCGTVPRLEGRLAHLSST